MPINLDIPALTKEYKLLHLIVHRNKNQHRQAKWWKYVAIVHRNVRKLISVKQDLSKAEFVKRRRRRRRASKQTQTQTKTMDAAEKRGSGKKKNGSKTAPQTSSPEEINHSQDYEPPKFAHLQLSELTLVKEESEKETRAQDRDTKREEVRKKARSKKHEGLKASTTSGLEEIYRSQAIPDFDHPEFNHIECAEYLVYKIIPKARNALMRLIALKQYIPLAMTLIAIFAKIWVLLRQDQKIFRPRKKGVAMTAKKEKYEVVDLGKVISRKAESDSGIDEDDSLGKEIHSVRFFEELSDSGDDYEYDDGPSLQIYDDEDDVTEPHDQATSDFMMYDDDLESEDDGGRAATQTKKSTSRSEYTKCSDADELKFF
ncbi:hypothetical protein BZA70DRAFT_277701 [Myxozyma melibiosi]|uniref:RNase MRP protein 1 RNA binding domain-containing protein n=1 Tax=Myxozyma melibiosi TaxID=54550 RepID=A0ABR1F883_9ASCO